MMKSTCEDAPSRAFFSQCKRMFFLVLWVCHHQFSAHWWLDSEAFVFVRVKGKSMDQFWSCRARRSRVSMLTCIF